MTAIAWCGLFLRWQGGALAALAAGHALLVTWVAWYLSDAAWASAPVSASPTPLPASTFLACWVGGTLFLLGVGSCIGSGAVTGPWVGPDPTLSLPLGQSSRILSAWVSSGSMLTVIALAPLPTYLSLFAMGAFAASDVPSPLLAQVGTIAIAPLPGIGLAIRRRWRPRDSHDTDTAA